MHRGSLEILRLLALREYRRGVPVMSIMMDLNMHRTTFYKWLRRYQECGREGLAMHKAPGARPKLSAAQRRRVQRWITAHTPRHYGFDTQRWTGKIVRQMMCDKLGVRLGLTSVYRLLKSLSPASDAENEAQPQQVIEAS